MNALGELASVIGGGIAAAWGGTPPLPDKVSARLARARIADMDEKMHEEFDAYRKTNLAEAIRRDKQTERATEKYLDHLYRINRDDKRSRDAAALQRERAATSEKIARERIEATQKATERKASSGSATRKTQSEKPVTYNDFDKSITLTAEAIKDRIRPNISYKPQPTIAGAKRLHRATLRITGNARENTHQNNILPQITTVPET